MAPPLIDPREVEMTTRVIEDLGLMLHRPELALQLRAINFAQPSHLDVLVWQGITGTVKPFQAFHQAYPFRVAPPRSISAGTFPLHLRQHADQQSISLDAGALQRHVLVVGSSGAGKTTLAQQIAHEAYRQALSVITIDAKSDAAYLLVQYPHTVLFGPEAPIPLLEVPSWSTRPEYVALLTRAAKRTWWGGEGLLQVATESLQATYAKHEHPTVRDWHQILNTLAKKGDTYTRRDRIDGMRLRLERFIERYPSIATTPAGSGISPDDICTKSIYFGFPIHTEVEDFLTNWLFELRFTHHRARDIRHLHTLALLDESVLLLHEETISESANLAPTFPLLREFGIACLLTTNNYQALPDAVQKNVSTHVLMSTSDAKERKDVSDTLGLNQAQREYLATKLAAGQCVIKTPEEWQFPVLATFKNEQRAKAIPQAEWHAAAQRTTSLARTSPLLLNSTSTAASKEGMTGWPTPAQVPSSSPLPTIAAAVLKPEKKPIALNANEERLLRFIAQRRVALTTEIDLHPEQVRRAKAKLSTLGLLREERIISHAGRGGSAVALAPTPAGYERVEIRSGGGGRGKLQHQFLALNMHRLLPGSRLEYSIGEKRIDLFITYDPTNTKHARLLRLLPEVALNTGDGIAIEIESSDPTKTAPSNIAHNATAGIALTITATLPKHVDHLRMIAPNAVDVFALLDVLARES